MTFFSFFFAICRFRLYSSAAGLTDVGIKGRGGTSVEEGRKTAAGRARGAHPGRPPLQTQRRARAEQLIMEIEEKY